MFNTVIAYKLIVFFTIGYSLLLLPLVILIKNRGTDSLLPLGQLQSTYNVRVFVLTSFFLLSGMPLTNMFLMKWFCVSSIIGNSGHYTTILFILINVATVLFYYSFFNRTVALISTDDLCANKTTYSSYIVHMYVLFSLHYNIFGVFTINYLIFIM